MASLGQRGGDAEALGDVVDHEADDQERPELKLAERERRPDREALTEVVHSDPDRDEQGEDDPCRTLSATGEAAREEGHSERAQRDSEEDEPGAAEGARERRLQCNRFGEGVDGEKRQEPGRERHERRQPARVGSPQRR